MEDIDLWEDKVLKRTNGENPIDILKKGEKENIPPRDLNEDIAGETNFLQMKKKVHEEEWAKKDIRRRRDKDRENSEDVLGECNGCTATEECTATA